MNTSLYENIGVEDQYPDGCNPEDWHPSEVIPFPTPKSPDPEPPPVAAVALEPPTRRLCHECGRPTNLTGLVIGPRGLMGAPLCAGCRVEIAA